MKKMSPFQKLMLASMSLLLTGMPASHAAETRTVLQSNENKPVVVETLSSSLKGTVVSIDYTTRFVKLKDAKGNMIIIEAGPDVSRLKEIKVKDIVKVDYLESTAFVVQSADKYVASAEGTQSVIVRNKTKKPSGEKTHTEVITATVVSIKPEKRIIVLKGPEGNQIKVNIAPDVTNLGNIKKGDNLVVTMTRSIALSVTKPK
jgi:arginine repressor